MKLGEKGFTMLELVIVTAIAALIANGVVVGVFQVLRNTESNRNQMTAVSQVENAGYWISHDVQRAQTVDAEGLGGGGERTVIVSWEQDTEGSLESSDGLYFAFSGDGGSSWSSDPGIVAFHGYPPSSFSYTIPSEYLTNYFRIRFYLDHFGASGEYLYLDNIAILEAIFSDDCSSYDDWDGDDRADWGLSSGRFRGHHSGSESDRYLAMSTTQDLSSYQGETVTVSWEQYTQGSIDPSDGLYFAFSSDNGSTWSSDIEAFHSYPPSSFSYTIPDQYLTSSFRMRFYLDYFGASDEYLYIDNIAISVPLWSDDCSSLADWDNGNDWDVYYGEFRGHHYYDPDSNRYITMNTSLDLTTEVFAAGFPLTFTWTTWSESGGTEHQVIYSMADGRLMRSYSVGGAPPTETLVAQYIDPYNSNCQFANGKLTFTVTATVGGGPAAESETREFQVLTRPD